MCVRACACACACLFDIATQLWNQLERVDSRSEIKINGKQVLRSDIESHIRGLVFATQDRVDLQALQVAEA